MEEDASLDDFLDPADDQEADPEDADEGAGREGGSSDTEAKEASEGPDADASEDADASGDAVRPDPSAVEPAGATYDWTPDGAACEACDEVVERRWRDEAGFVCENCKDW